LPKLSFAHSFLRERLYAPLGEFVHNNPDVFGALRAFEPQVVVTTGYSPTFLYAFAYARLFKRRHVAMTDGTLASEANLSRMHRFLRRWVLQRSDAYVVASEGGRALFRAYGVDDDRVHLSPLCANTSVSWRDIDPCSAGLDFLFSGRLVAIKNPSFALHVAHGVARRIGRRVTLGILGSGPLEAGLRAEAAAMGDSVAVRFGGHVPQAELPAWYASARVFLFPTAWDPWGVVANEACLAGVPIIVSPHAGAAGELVRNDVNGYVRPVELSAWIEAASSLLEDSALHARLSDQARVEVLPYSVENAARGIAAASIAAIERSSRVG
jgi:glycosyltransferase involved in cell wall biosynthesis